MRLAAGMRAPTFEATTLRGDPVQLDALRGRRVWLSFYRYASCPLCCYRVHELIAAWDATFRDLDVLCLAVWQSPREKLQDVLDRYQPPFALISDPQLHLYEAFSVEKGLWKMLGKEVATGLAGAREAGIPLVRPWDGPATRRPADFLISPQGTIDVAFYGENVGHHIPFEDVVAWAQPAGRAGP